ncbi:glycosyltransferase [Rahnella victoriana]|uniref:Glycosyltransferase family 2 protein n=1 Tax=Rahnella victoriana TaxID=1510570 RepID=A0ABS0DKL0_9GAMM|nr:glycosyltransferase family A protein [Rahnella victoriana]MBF7954427.1 glycosyltransferase family 2 protein [Rahnella victoriana]TBX30599.1 glycosyltransferase family 2 protein [Rahnella victoriana]
MRYFIAIPTYNGGDVWEECAKNIKNYIPEKTSVYVIDSGSSDRTMNVADKYGFEHISISSKDFNHGGTRNLAVENNKGKYDFVIFLTQDAIPEPHFVENILSAFQDPKVACAYGRQLPHKRASKIAQHARYFSYPEKGYVAELSDKTKKGIKTVFMSNSFSAYRLDVFEKLGGFTSNTILCEDMYFTAKAVLSGYKVAYVSDAIVRHSHNYSPLEEFKRYFDIGVFHADEPWIRKEFGGAEGEGKKFIFSEIKYLIANGFYLIPVACINTASKLLGYKLGGKYKKMPLSIIKKISMHKRYW